MNQNTAIPEKWDLAVNLIAVGSSSGRLTVAITGHDLGFSTVVIEKAERLGEGLHRYIYYALWQKIYITT